MIFFGRNHTFIFRPFKYNTPTILNLFDFHALTNRCRIIRRDNGLFCFLYQIFLIKKLYGGQGHLIALCWFIVFFVIDLILETLKLNCIILVGNLIAPHLLSLIHQINEAVYWSLNVRNFVVILKCALEIFKIIGFKMWGEVAPITFLLLFLNCIWQAFLNAL